MYWDYERSTEALPIRIPYSVFVPTSCGYSREFILLDPFTNREPRYASIDGNNMLIYTDDFNHCGDRTLRLSIGIADHHAAPATFQYYITITCCAFAQIEAGKTYFPDLTYSIGEDGELEFDPIWEVTNGDPAGCELTYSFTPSSPTNVLSIDQDMGILLLETNDKTLAGQVIDVTFTAKVVASGETATIDFKVTFEDECQGSLQPPEAIDEPPFYFTLFEEDTFSFTLASIPTSLAECSDTFVYTLLNDVNNAQVGDEFGLEPKLS